MRQVGQVGVFTRTLNRRWNILKLCPAPTGIDLEGYFHNPEDSIHGEYSFGPVNPPWVDYQEYWGIRFRPAHFSFRDDDSTFCSAYSTKIFPVNATEGKLFFECESRLCQTGMLTVQKGNRVSEKSPCF